MKRHSTDVVSLVFGLIFIVIAVWWAIGSYVNVDLVDIPNFGWIAAGALIVLGALGVLASLRSDRQEPAETPIEEEATVAVGEADDRG